MERYELAMRTAAIRNGISSLQNEQVSQIDTEIINAHFVGNACNNADESAGYKETNISLGYFKFVVARFIGLITPENRQPKKHKRQSALLRAQTQNVAPRFTRPVRPMNRRATKNPLLVTLLQNRSCPIHRAGCIMPMNRRATERPTFRYVWTKTVWGAAICQPAAWQHYANLA